MAISTLSKITVPLDSSASASNQGLLMPKEWIKKEEKKRK